MRVAKLYGFSGNRITASKPMARKMRKPANNPPGATECSRTWPPWTTLTPLRQPPTGRSGARCGHCPVERVGASLEGKLLSEPQGVLHRGDTETRRKRGDPEGLRCGGPPCLHGGPLPESPTRPEPSRTAMLGLKSHSLSPLQHLARAVEAGGAHHAAAGVGAGAA